LLHVNTQTTDDGVSRVTKKIAYEQPLNERIRTFMRLEFLLQQMQANLDGQRMWDARASLQSILDVQSVFSRADIKTELIKELERLGSVLERLAENPNVDARKLTQVLADIDLYTDRLHSLPGPIGHELKDNELLSAIRQRSSIPGGACQFDLPGYHFWLEQPSERRHEDLLNWFRLFETPMLAAQLILRMIRESAPVTDVIALEGFFQQNLDATTPSQLVRVIVPATCPYYAEVSAGKHRFAVRFMTLRMNERDIPARETVSFQLTCATI